MIAKLHQAILDTETRKLGCVITGGGAEAITKLLSLGGMSKVLQEYSVPYSQEALSSFVFNSPIEKSCSFATALIMAAAQVKRLNDLGVPYSQQRVLSCTASLFKEGQREGRANCAYIVTAQEGSINFEVWYALEKTRAAQEEALALHILTILARWTPLKKWDGCSLFDFQRYYLQPEPLNETSPVIFSGAFNPAHEAHREIVKRAATKFIDRKILIELAVNNADKGLLCPTEISKRLDQLKDNFNFGEYEWSHRIIIRHSLVSKWIDKVRPYVFPVALVGMDTLQRICNKEYYKNDEEYIKAMLTLGQKVHFEVPYRTGISLDSLNKTVPSAILDNCSFFHHNFEDISSTAIRNQNATI